MNANGSQVALYGLDLKAIIVNMKRLHLSAWLILVLAMAGCRGQSVDQPALRKTPVRFDDAIDLLKKHASIGTDAQLKKYAEARYLLPTFVAPEHFRLFLRNKGLQVVYVDEMQFHWREGKVLLVWSGNFSILGERATAVNVLERIFVEEGLSDGAGTSASQLVGEYHAFVKERNESFEKSKISPNGQPRNAWIRSRKSERVLEELLILQFSQGDGGEQPGCSARYKWGVECDYAGNPPTLKELLNSMPALKPLHREDALFDRLQDEFVYVYSNYARLVTPTEDNKEVTAGTWRLSTAATVRGDVEAILKAQGFVPLKDGNPPPTPQLTWGRLANATYANLAEDKDHKDRIRIQCQAPQR